MKMINLGKNLYDAFISPHPTYLILYVTARCNARCQMCFYWQNLNKQHDLELTLDEFSKISSKMNRLIQLSIAGGEPTLRKDLPQICQLFIRNNDVKYITLPTNGINTQDIVGHVEQIATENPQTHLRVSVSLDGPQEVHDEIRGVPGAYVKAYATFQEIKKMKASFKNLSVDIASVLQNLNQDILYDFVKYVHANMSPDNHMVMLTRGNPRMTSTNNIILNRYHEILELKKSLDKIAESRPLSKIIRILNEQSCDVVEKVAGGQGFQISCYAGKKLVVISEKGEVFPCELLPNSFGNLRDHQYSLKEIFSLPAYRKQLQFISKNRCHCTFECAINLSILYAWKRYLSMLIKYFK
jgi:MoaA/NifB/PqqE/SkfB family radical SAM enzyme